MASIKDLRNSLTRLANVHSLTYDTMSNRTSFPMKAKNTALACARFGKMREWQKIQAKLLRIRNADKHRYSVIFTTDKKVVQAAIELFNEALPAKQLDLRISDRTAF